jgi:phospholipase C
MPTNVYVANSLPQTLSAVTRISPALSGDHWSDPDPGSGTGLPTGGGDTEIYWIDREEGITDGETWVVTSSVTVGGSALSLQVRLTGTLVGSDIAVQIAMDGDGTGWQADNTRLNFTAADGNGYAVIATYVSDGLYDDVVFAVGERQATILPQIEHVVVLMMENRSLDNLLGWIYPSGAAPAHVLPAGSSPDYDGLNPSLSNSDPSVNGGQPVHVSNGTTDWDEGAVPVSQWFVPKPDPGEEFDHVTTQVSNDMGGFLTDYVTQQAGTPAEQIMQCYSVAQLPIISTLATSFAVSDAWFCSVPSQTWPNRGFVQTGSSDGNINNNYVPWDINTVFDVLGGNGLSWMVYNDGALPSLTKTMFLGKYITNDTNFSGIGAFQAACAQPASAPTSQKLPAFSFVEPNFGIIGNDQSYHPPHDVRPGEEFLATIYTAIQQSPYRDSILFILLFDEHGGTYDHVEPPEGAKPPEPGAVSSHENFTFDRFGVRVPAIIMSSWVTPGTVFRSNIDVPLDHGSVLATLRDWQGLSAAFAASLPSPRIGAAPNLAYVLTETEAQEWPTLPTPPASLAVIPEPDDSEPLNGVQQSVLIGASGVAAGRPLTAPEALAARARLRTHGDGRAFLMALQSHLPMR